MNMLDEVIFGAPYTPTPWEADALHYLKEYRDYRNADKTVNENGSVSDAENNALTWDELQAMEGKPVWVEITYPGKSWGEWDIVCRIENENEMTTYRDDYERKQMSKTWQAYRKERR